MGVFTHPPPARTLQKSAGLQELREVGLPGELDIPGHHARVAGILQAPAAVGCQIGRVETVEPPQLRGPYVAQEVDGCIPLMAGYLLALYSLGLDVVCQA